VQIVLIWSYE